MPNAEPRQRAPLWMRTLLRLWPGGRASKRDDAPISNETLRRYLDEREDVMTDIANFVDSAPRNPTPEQAPELRRQLMKITEKAERALEHR